MQEEMLCSPSLMVEKKFSELWYGEVISYPLGSVSNHSRKAGPWGKLNICLREVFWYQRQDHKPKQILCWRWCGSPCPFCSSDQPSCRTSGHSVMVLCLTATKLNNHGSWLPTSFPWGLGETPGWSCWKVFSIRVTTLSLFPLQNTLRNSAGRALRELDITIYCCYYTEFTLRCQGNSSSTRYRVGVTAYVLTPTN